MPDNYDFIMNSGPPAKRSSFGGGGKGQLLMLLGGVGVLLIIIMIVLSVVLGGGPSNKNQLLDVALRQNQLLYVAAEGVKEAQTSQAKNLAVTTKLSLYSDQAPLLAALKAQKVKVKLPSGVSAEITTMLNTAKQNNRFDEAFLEYLQKELVTYQKSLNSAYQTTVSVALKQTLKTQYENASIIIGVEPET